jgi:A/G-specific adenine glycosylase
MPSANHSSRAIPASIPETDLPQFRRRLLGWFHRSKRDLAWRRTRDPYRIWISEIMLQQTRVAAVIPYYRKFCARFPTVRRLAQARSESVLRAWTGLGYYSRARNLHRAAQDIMARHAGKFPRDLAPALALPGIGAYTAAAVLSIAYDEPHAVLDGNVARVLARLGAVRGDLRQPKKWRSLQQSATRLLAPNAPGDWNQAMMELGATLCTPRAPRCDECPVAQWCRARSLGIAERLPSARRKPGTVRMALAAAVLLDFEGRTLMVRQQKNAPREAYRGANGAFFSRLWQFPAVAAGSDSRAELARHIAATFDLRDVSLAPIATSRHAVTFHNIRLAPFLVRVARLPEIAGTRTPRLAELDRLPISSATRKIAAAAIASL